MNPSILFFVCVKVAITTFFFSLSLSHAPTLYLSESTVPFLLWLKCIVSLFISHLHTLMQRLSLTEMSAANPLCHSLSHFFNCPYTRNRTPIRIQLSALCHTFSLSLSLSLSHNTHTISLSIFLSHSRTHTYPTKKILAHFNTSSALAKVSLSAVDFFHS